ncbi:MAG: ATP-binding cassette domain-containing protein [Bacilli bacterium]
MIKIHNLKKTFPGEKILLNIKSQTFPARGLFAIIGDSGAGKSTLLKLIAGLDQKYTGDIFFNQQSIKYFSAREASDYRAFHVGFVFQDFQLLPLDSIKNNILLPFLYLRNFDQETQLRRVNELLSIVGLDVDAKRTVNTLSGGEKQRVAIARSLVINPDFILADEPTGALDQENKEQIMRLLSDIAQQKLVIVVSHDLALMEKYASKILELKNGDLILLNEQPLIEKARCHLSILRINKEYPKFHLPLNLIILHHYHTLKHKRGRTLLAQFAMSLGLVALGLSFLITNSVSTQIQMMLNGLFESHQIMVSAKNQSEKAQTKIAIPQDQVQKIADTYPLDVQRIGVNYEANFEQFFPDENKLVLASTAMKIPLVSFNIRHINDYCWLPAVQEEIYPSSPVIMEEDQLILGLPISDFNTLVQALYLHPLTTFADVGEYLTHHNVQVAFELKNDNWHYEDQQIFQIIGIYPSLHPQVAHDNPLWNQTVFEDNMRLKSTLDFIQPVNLPWTLRKAYFLDVKNSAKFLDMAIRNPQFNPFILHPLRKSEEELNTLPSQIRVFQKNSNNVNFSDIELIYTSSNNIMTFYPTSNGAYLAFPEALMVGFTRTMLISASIEELLVITENNLLNETAKKEQNIIFPPHVAVGSLKGLSDNNVRFSSTLKNVYHGEQPEDIHQIAISTALAKKVFGHLDVINTNLHIAVSDNSVFTTNSIIKNSFKFQRLQITGLVEDNQMFIYQEPSWLITYYSLVLAIDAFELQPTGFMLKVNEQCELEKYVSELNEQFPYLNFVIPTSELTKAVVLTTAQIEKIILVIASTAIIIAFLLIIVVSYLTMLEEQAIGRLLHQLGISRGEQQRFFMLLSPIIGGISFCIAAFELLILQITFHQLFQTYFHTNGQYQFYIKPLIIMISVAFILSFLSGKVVTIFYKNQG